MKIIKRSGMEVEFDREKITNAVRRANVSVVEQEQMNEEQIQEISRMWRLSAPGWGAPSAWRRFRIWWKIRL